MKAKVLTLLTAILFTVDMMAQITYSNGNLNINNAPSNKVITGLNINTWPGFYWTCCAETRFFQLDVSPSSPRIAGTGNKIVFYNTATNKYNSIEVANVYNLSDARAKENINPLSTGLSTILQLNPVTYNWKTTTQQEDEISTLSSDSTTIAKGPDGEGLQYGFLAQDVEKIIPSAVQTNENGQKLINYTAIIPILVEAVKELQTTVEAQAQTIPKLSNASSAYKKANSKIISCSPNPSNGMVTVSTQMENGVTNCYLTISSLTGTTKKTVKLSQDSEATQVDVTSLSKGIYIVSLFTNGQIADTKRLIKE